MACEKCWYDANFLHHIVDPRKSVSEHYRELLEERKDNPCSWEDQDGETTVEAFIDGGTKTSTSTQ